MMTRDNPTRRRLGLAPLSLISVAPPRLVEVASNAGFDFIGVRVRPVTDSEPVYNMQPGSPLLTETLSRMADTGITVKDIEFLLLDGSDQRDHWRAMFEAGQALGASSMTVAVADTDASRVVDTLAQMVDDGRAYGITPALEAISYQAVNSLPEASRVAEQTGADVLVDTLHVGRFGGVESELQAVAPKIPMVQLCDAPGQRPSDRSGLAFESRSRRLPAGEGDFALLDMIRAVERGRADAGQDSPPLPISLEVPNDEARGRLGASGWANHLMNTTVHLLGEE